MANISKRRKIIILAVVAVFAVGAYLIFFKPKTGNTSSMVYTYDTAQIGTISQSVTGTGQISASRQTDLKSEVSGDILKVGVAVGQQVKAGDVIARLGDKDAQNSLKDAQTALDTAKLSLEKLNEPADELSLTQAQNALEQADESLAANREDLEKSYEQGFSAVSSVFIYLSDAVSGLKDVVVGSSSYIVQSSSTYLDYYYDSIKNYDSQAASFESKAASSYQKVQLAYDKNFQDYKAASASSDKEQIEFLIDETYETSKIIAEALKNATTLIQRYKDVVAANNGVPQSFANTQMTSLSGYVTGINSRAGDLYSARQNIESAKAAIINSQRSVDEKSQSLAKLQQEPDVLDVRSQELVIAQKERLLADAAEQLEKYAIKAPFDGMIAQMGAKEGDSVAANGSVATIITSNQIATISLNEVDIAKVEAGQKATLTFSAIDGLMMTGKVAEVDQIGTVSQGVVSYDVIIAMDTQDAQVKSGMSVTAMIITRMKQNVLLVPGGAVKTDNNDFYVLVASSTDGNAGDLARRQTVATGLSDDISTEITQGLSEGDIVVASSSAKTAAKASVSGSNNSGANRSLFNIGGGGPGR